LIHYYLKQGKGGKGSKHQGSKNAGSVTSFEREKTNSVTGCDLSTTPRPVVMLERIDQ